MTTVDVQTYFVFKDVVFVLSILMSIYRWTWVSQYQNVSILDFIGVKGDGGGGDNWSYKTCKALIKMSQPTNQHPYQ